MELTTRGADIGSIAMELTTIGDNIKSMAVELVTVNSKKLNTGHVKKVVTKFDADNNIESNIVATHSH